MVSDAYDCPVSWAVLQYLLKCVLSKSSCLNTLYGTQSLSVTICATMSDNSMKVKTISLLMPYLALIISLVSPKHTYMNLIQKYLLCVFLKN